MTVANRRVLHAGIVSLLVHAVIWQLLFAENAFLSQRSSGGAGTAIRPTMINAILRPVRTDLIAPASSVDPVPATTKRKSKNRSFSRNSRLTAAYKNMPFLREAESQKVAVPTLARDQQLVQNDVLTSYKISLARASKDLIHQLNLPVVSDLEGRVVLVVRLPTSFAAVPIVSVEQSSGYSILDQAVKKLLTEATRKIAVPPELRQSGLQIELPVISQGVR